VAKVTFLSSYFVKAASPETRMMERSKSNFIAANLEQVFKFAIRGDTQG
jgi:hypothetical protein